MCKFNIIILFDRGTVCLIVPAVGNIESYHGVLGTGDWDLEGCWLNLAV